jgi:thimet oligopeptidase
MPTLRRVLMPFAMLSGALLASAANAASELDREVDALLAQQVVTVTTAAAVKQRCDAVLALSKRVRTALEARKGAATLDGDYAAYDTLSLLLYDGAGDLYLVGETSPSKEARDAVQECLPRLQEETTAASLSRPIYDRLAAIPRTGLDADTNYTLQKQLITYRLSGVDKDEATRNKVAALQKQIIETGLSFSKNIRDDKGDVPFKPADLAGTPQDFLDSHKPGADGLVHLTLDATDISPVMQFATSRATRRAATTAYYNRGYPANDAVLKRLLEQRYELARLLGYPDYATLVTADKMIGSPQRAAQFLDDVNKAALAGAAADMAELLTFAKNLDPSVERLERYDSAYMGNLLRKQKYEVDAAEVRQYFSFEKTRGGIFALVHDLFGADIRPWKEGKPWHPSVSAWELYDGSKLIGRFYLDMHPREGKYNHAAQFSIRTGVEGRQLPIGALVTNFPATGPMNHSDVETFLHEFGHLIHYLYSGHTRYFTQSMGNLQWDFIEAPSQLLEEWVWDYDTLKTFASNAAGQPIPESLVKKMNAGRRFGEALDAKGQLAYSAVSLNYYNRKPDFDLTRMFDQQYSAYAAFPPLAGTHQYASFGHLDGYSAIYYTYVWSKAIAVDLFTRFKAAGIRNPEVAQRYRRLVLEPGGGRDANALIEAFLGRGLSLEPFKEELLRK